MLRSATRTARSPFSRLAAAPASTCDPRATRRCGASSVAQDRDQGSVRTLGSIFAEHAKDRDIDVVSIDAEGAEAAILRGAQLDKFRPKLIVIEAMAANVQVDASEEASKLLEQNGYILGYEDGLNKFFVAKERGELLEALRYPPNIFDHYITAHQLDLQRKSRRRLRLLQITLAAWAISVVGLVLMLWR